MTPLLHKNNSSESTLKMNLGARIISSLPATLVTNRYDLSKTLKVTMEGLDGITSSFPGLLMYSRVFHLIPSLLPSYLKINTTFVKHRKVPIQDSEIQKPANLTAAKTHTHQVDPHILTQRKCRVSKYLQCSRLISRLLNGRNRDSNIVSLTHFWAVQTIYLLSTTVRGYVHNFLHSLRYNRYKKSDQNRSQIAILPEVSLPFLACVHFQRRDSTVRDEITTVW